MLQDDTYELGIQIPRLKSVYILRSNIDQLCNTLYRIREVNNRIKIRLTRMKTIIKIREVQSDGDLNRVSLFINLLSEPDYLSDVDMSDDES